MKNKLTLNKTLKKENLPSKEDELTSEQKDEIIYLYEAFFEKMFDVNDDVIETFAKKKTTNNKCKH